MLAAANSKVSENPSAPPTKSHSRRGGGSSVWSLAFRSLKFWPKRWPGRRSTAIAEVLRPRHSGLSSPKDVGVWSWHGDVDLDGIPRERFIDDIGRVGATAVVDNFWLPPPSRTAAAPIAAPCSAADRNPSGWNSIRTNLVGLRARFSGRQSPPCPARPLVVQLAPFAHGHLHNSNADEVGVLAHFPLAWSRHGVLGGRRLGLLLLRCV